jgi:hypothetical protein
VLGLNRHLNILENYWMADHATGPPAERDEPNPRPTDYRPTLAFDEHPLTSV